MRPAIKKFVLIPLAAVAAPALLAALAALVYFKTAYFPDWTGELRVKGIHGDITILRDEYGIPHIFAQSARDAFFAQGFVQARDRTLQLELYKRFTAGRVAELVGKDMLPLDKLSRLLDYRGQAEEIYRNLDPRAREIMRAYVDGINAGYESLGSNLPAEFRAFGITPTPWDVYDPLAFSRQATWNNSKDYQTEYLQMRLAEELGTARALELAPYSAPLPEAPARAPALLPFVASGARLAHALAPTLSCNNWALGRDRTVSGKAILVFDAHTGAPVIPVEVYLMHLKGGDELDVAGGAIVGVPGMYSGNTRHIAWGMTNVGGDTQDLYRERVDPHNPGRYLYKGEWRDMAVRREKLCWKKGLPFSKRKQCETVEFHSTVHGPVVSGVLVDQAGRGEVLALRWAGHMPGADLSGYIKMNFAENWGQFREALAHFSHAAQHYTYADRDGNIGYQVGGLMPLREDNVPPALPARGWLGENQWLRLLSIDELPHAYNPAGGALATANHCPVENNRPYYLGSQFAPPQRRNRLVEMLASKDKFSFEDIMRQRRDVYSHTARDIAPVLAADLARSPNPRHREFASALNSWNHTMNKDEWAPLLFETLFYLAARETLADELGGDLAAEYMNDRYMFLERYMLMLRDPQNKWFDDVRTRDKKETREDIVLRAADMAAPFLEKRLGRDRSKWAWGALHRITFAHYASAAAPFLSFLNIGPFPMSGGNETIDRNGFSYKDPFAVRNIGIMRVVVDFADPDAVYAVTTHGQSAWWGSPHYGDQARVWLEGDLIRIPMNYDEALKTSRTRMTLKPAK